MILVAILNHNRPIEYVTSLVESIKDQSLDVEIIISTNNDEITADTIGVMDVLNNEDTTVAQAKNTIIEYSRGQNADYLYIIEDDIEIISPETLSTYLTTLKMLNLGVIFSGYGDNSNYVLTKPSPRVRLILGKFGAVVCNRHESGEFVLIDVNKNRELFNTEFTCYEFSEWVFRCWKCGHLPYLNQFFDIDNPWDFIKPLESADTIRHFEVGTLDVDKKILDTIINNEWEIENNVGRVVEYIREQTGDDL